MTVQGSTNRHRRTEELAVYAAAGVRRHNRNALLLERKLRDLERRCRDLEDRTVAGRLRRLRESWRRHVSPVLYADVRLDGWRVRLVK